MQTLEITKTNNSNMIKEIITCGIILDLKFEEEKKKPFRIEN